MIGNKYSGDNIATEFYKMMLLKKTATDETSVVEKPEVKTYKDHVEEEVVNPEDFLQKLAPTLDFAENEMNQKIENLDSWARDNLTPENEMYSEDNSYLLDRRASEVLSGLGKIAGGLRIRGEIFASDIVEATALSIKNDMIKEAEEKLEIINLLTKISSDISDSGDKFTSDIVTATIKKIKNK